MVGSGNLDFFTPGGCGLVSFTDQVATALSLDEDLRRWGFGMLPMPCGYCRHSDALVVHVDVPRAVQRRYDPQNRRPKEKGPRSLST